MCISVLTEWSTTILFHITIVNLVSGNSFPSLCFFYPTVYRSIYGWTRIGKNYVQPGNHKLHCSPYIIFQHKQLRRTVAEMKLEDQIKFISS